MTRFLLKAEEGEQVKNSIPWELTFYDDNYQTIYTITEFQRIEENAISEDSEVREWK